jgi:hypothetical protein
MWNNLVKSIPKDADHWLYEILHALAVNQQSVSLGFAAIIRGENPDGSGTPQQDLSKYFYLPGRSGGQVAHGAVESAGSLTFSSTIAPTKGYIYLGADRNCIYDETNGRLGIGLG